MHELDTLTDHGRSAEVRVQSEGWSRSGGLLIDIYTERGNLYPLTIDPVPATLHEVASRERGRTWRRLCLDRREQGTEVSATPGRIARAVKRRLVEALKEAGFRLSRDDNFLFDTRSGRVDSRTPFLRELPSYRLRVMEVGEDLYLCLNYHLRLKNCYQLVKLREVDPDLALRQQFAYATDTERLQAAVVPVGWSYLIVAVVAVVAVSFDALVRRTVASDQYLCGRLVWGVLGWWKRWTVILAVTLALGIVINLTSASVQAPAGLQPSGRGEP